MMTRDTKEFEPVTESVSSARRFVRSAVGPLDADLADDAALLVSELATNAVIHAATRYSVTVTQVDGGIRIDVRDESPATARRCRYGTDAATGRGLGMVADLSASWGVDIDGDGKVVWFVLHVTDGAQYAASAAAVAVTPDGEVDLDALLAGLGGDWSDEPEQGATRSMRQMVLQ
jgi:anti-sigma regulatory factor (Ser/Thr protein kinase)